MLLVIALQTPASKLPRTPQSPPHPRQEPSRPSVTSDEDRTTMYRASTPTGAELLSHPRPQCNTHRQGYRRFEHENWIREQIKGVLLCVNCEQGLYSDNRRPPYSSIFCSRTELLKYLAIDSDCLVKHQHRTDVSDRVSQLFSFNYISGEIFLFSIL